MKLSQPKTYKEYVDAQVARHTSEHHEYPLSSWHEDIFNEFKSYLKEPIIDIGTRNGAILDELKKKGYEMAWGIELTDLARFAQQEKKRNVIQCDAQFYIPFPNKFFKSAILTHTLEHFYNPNAAIEEIKRILNGHILIISPEGGRLDDPTWKGYGHFCGFDSLEEMAEFLEKNGFEIVKTYRKGPFHLAVIAKI